MYTTPGNYSELGYEACRNVGRRCAWHKIYYIYSHRDDLIIGILIWFGPTSDWRLESFYDKLVDRYRRNARQNKIMHIYNIEHYKEWFCTSQLFC